MGKNRCVEERIARAYLIGPIASFLSMDLTPLVASFVLVVVAELGDKTQIAVITLASRFKILSVFLGAILAFLLTTGIAVIIGDALSLVLPTFPIVYVLVQAQNQTIGPPKYEL